MGTLLSKTEDFSPYSLSMGAPFCFLGDAITLAATLSKSEWTLLVIPFEAGRIDQVLILKRYYYGWLSQNVSFIYFVCWTSF